MSEIEEYKDFFQAYPSDTDDEDDEISHIKTPQQQGNPKSISKDDIFLKGVAISMWQNSGDETSNWTKFINEKNILGNRYRVEDGSFNVFPNFWEKS